jgi:rhamnogalacturonyl hydrolase YesR
MAKLSFLPFLAAGWLSVLNFSIAARPRSYAAWVADSVIRRGQGNGLDASGKAIVSYEHGELQFGLRQLYELTRNETYYNYIVTGANNVVYDNGTVHGAYTCVYLTRFLASA